MGNYVLRNGLQALRAKDEKALVRLFDQIILAAPDEDDDTFETPDKLALITRICRQVTVYFNPHDKALIISDKTKGNPDRLGSDGPRLIDLIPKKIVLVDCRIVRSVGDKLVDHSYYLNSAAMRTDLAGVLTSPPPDLFPNRVYVPDKRVYRIVAELNG
jgi:esterase/lipase superfamily enzyme